MGHVRRRFDQKCSLLNHCANSQMRLSCPVILPRCLIIGHLVLDLVKWVCTILCQMLNSCLYDMAGPQELTCKEGDKEQDSCWQNRGCCKGRQEEGQGLRYKPSCAACCWQSNREESCLLLAIISVWTLAAVFTLVHFICSNLVRVSRSHRL